MLDSMRSRIGRESCDAALEYISFGWSALALCPPDHSGVGPKHSERCTSPGKTPWHKWKQFQETPATEQEIRELWRRNPRSNVGVALGPVSNLIRVDIDGEAGELLLSERGDIPETIEFRRGNAGSRGLLYRIPNGAKLRTTIHNGKGDHSELRFQAKGAQTVLPPSLHASGDRYAWTPGHSPDDGMVTIAPAWLIDELTQRPTQTTRGPSMNPENEVATAISALWALGTHRADSYDDWLHVGMALRSVDPSEGMLSIWEQWSHARCPVKYRDGECRSKWDSFNGHSNGFTIASLIHWAGQDSGWTLPRPSVPSNSRTKSSKTVVESVPQGNESAEQTADLPSPVTRVRIEVTPNQHVVVAEIIEALAADPRIYRRSGRLVHVVRERTETDDDGIIRAKGTPRIVPVSAGFLRERMAHDCYFWKIVTRGNHEAEQHIDPPGWAVDCIHGRGFWESLRLLSGITETPVLRPDGTILNAPGWDEQTGLLYEPGCAIPGIQENPDRATAWAARDLLLDLISDFPFAAETHRASWLAGLLTVLSRRAFSGPAPLFLIDANVRGSGKSLLTDLVAIITTGREMPRFSNPGTDDESRKRITALALAGDPLVLIDNIASTLGTASLDAALTGTVWKDRLLGFNEIVECALRAVWFASGNNVICAGDMSRRVCHVRLDSPEECPEERTGFRHPNLLQYVRQHRLELLAAGLTVLRAFVVAGRPDAGLKPWGSFEGWSGLIRNCIVWLGLPDPGETRRELAEASDRDAASLRMLFAGWAEVDPDENGLTSAALVKLLASNEEHYAGVRDALQELCDTKGGKGGGLAAQAVGNQLRRFKGRVIGQKRLQSIQDRHKKVSRWVVASCGAGSAGSAGPVSLPSRARTGESETGKNLGETHPALPAHPATEMEGCPVCGFPLTGDGEFCEYCTRQVPV